MWHPPLSSACLMFAAVCLDASLPPSHHLVLGCVPSLSACLGSCLFPLRPAIDVDAAAVPWLFVSPPAPPHRHDGRGDTTGVWRFSRLCLLAPLLAIPSVRFGIGWRRGCSLLRPMAIVGADLLSARSPNQISSPSCRPAAPSSHRLSPRSLDTGDGAGFLISAACLCGSISSAVYLCWFCVLRWRGLPCLLEWRIFILVDG